MRRTVVDPRFGSMLAGLITTAGVSQRVLASQAHISRSYLSEIINGQKMPSDEIARALDHALAADGQLANLVALASRADDLDRLAAAAAQPRRIGAAVVESLARVLRGQRYLDDTMGSAALLGPVVAQMGSITTMVREAIGPNRAHLLYVAAQWAQFAGWLHLSAGQWNEARDWFARALEWATEHGDPDLTATVVSYQGHLAWLTLQWPTSVGLARAALRDPVVYPGQRAYDAYAAARGHAALGDLADAEHLLAAGDDLAAQSNAWVGEKPDWQYYRASWLWQLERGLVLLYMARHDRRRAEAAVLALRAGLDGVPEEMRGADWAAEYMTHLATGFTYAGATVSARETLEQARAVAEATRSTRVLRMVKGRERRLTFEGLTG